MFTYTGHTWSLPLEAKIYLLLSEMQFLSTPNFPWVTVKYLQTKFDDSTCPILLFIRKLSFSCPRLVCCLFVCFHEYLNTLRTKIGLPLVGMWRPYINMELEAASLWAAAWAAKAVMTGSGKAVLFLALIFLQILFIAPCNKKRELSPSARILRPKREKKRQMRDAEWAVGNLEKVWTNRFSNIYIHAYICRHKSIIRLFIMCLIGTFLP